MEREMKKCAYLFVLFGLLSSSALCQTNWFFDNFDSYTAGQKVACQNNINWTTWSNAPCGSEDGTVSNLFSFSSPNSALIIQNNDLVCPLPNWTTGKYSVEFQSYIPTGKAGYFNVLQLFAGASSQWGFECYFNLNGSGSVNAGGTGTATFTWIPATWVPVKVLVDLDNDNAEFYYNNVFVKSWVWSTGATGTGTLNQLGGVDLFGATANDFLYVDDFSIIDQLASPPFITVTAPARGVHWQIGQYYDILWNDNITENVGIHLYEGSSRVKAIARDTESDGVFNWRPTRTLVPGSNYKILIRSRVTPSIKGYSGRFVIDPMADGYVGNFPNPFNPSTVISYSIPFDGVVNLVVYNSIGEIVSELVNSAQAAGNYDVSFNANGLSSGIYFYRLTASSDQGETFNVVKKMMYLK
jgi:hypothetical protein